MAILSGALVLKADVPPESGDSKDGRHSFARAANRVRQACRATFICCVSLAGLSASGQGAKEYDLKAAFLCKFALFVISGGVYIKGEFAGTPLGNTAFLADRKSVV